MSKRSYPFIATILITLIAVFSQGNAVASANDDTALVTKKGSTFKLYGFIRLDAIYDDSEPNDNQIIGYIRSEDASSGVKKDNSSFTMTPRLSRIGMLFNAPDTGSALKIDGKIELDFYAWPASDSRNMLRMRHAYLRLKGDDYSILAGQTSDLISPLYPSVNYDMVMWGAGNLGDRRPQFRFDYHPSVGSGRIFIQAALGLTGAIAGENYDGRGVTNGENSGKPTVQGRIAYRIPSFVGKQRLEIGVWGHRAWEKSDTAVAGQTEWDSIAYGVDAFIPLFTESLTLQGELWFGSNVDDVRGGIFQGVNATTGKEIDANGGWIELGLKTSDNNSLSIGYSFDDPDYEDIDNEGRDKNLIYYFADKFKVTDPVYIGMEYLSWTTQYKGLDDGTDNRVKLYAMYMF